jgi:hypothetical protein
VLGQGQRSGGMHQICVCASALGWRADGWRACRMRPRIQLVATNPFSLSMPVYVCSLHSQYLTSTCFPCSTPVPQVCEESERRLPTMGPQEMCDLAWSLALFSHTPPPDWMSALERALADKWVASV